MAGKVLTWKVCVMRKSEPIGDFNDDERKLLIEGLKRYVGSVVRRGIWPVILPKRMGSPDLPCVSAAGFITLYHTYWNGMCKKSSPPYSQVIN
jgi:hypothetical protein